MNKPKTTNTLKLQKVIADTGYTSRRKAEQLIEAGRVRVDNKIATIGDRVSLKAKITIDNKPLYRKAANRPRLLVYNKPPGEVCTSSDPEGRPTVFAKLPALNKGRWIQIGRLDYNTQGLLLFTNDGEIANQYMHPSNEFEREYLVRVIGEVTDDQMTNFKVGMSLEDGWAQFEDIRPAAHAGGKNKWYKVILKEGRNRIIRRLFEAQDLTISRLMRVRFGAISLPRNLKQGEWQEITPPKDEDSAP